MTYNSAICGTVQLPHIRPVVGIPVRLLPFACASRNGQRQKNKQDARRVEVHATDPSIIAESASSSIASPILGVLAVAVIAAIGFVGSRSLAQIYPEAMFGNGKRTGDAVLVFGSTGKMGRAIVQQLLQQGRAVVAATRDAQKGKDVFADLEQQYGSSALTIQGGIDITEKSSLESQKLWQGVSQVAIAVGPVFGRQPGGEMGYSHNMTSERVDAKGVTNIAEAAKKFLPSKNERQIQTVLSMKTAKETRRWDRLDDVIMGGQSSSGLEASGSGAVWSGDLILEGGGFCGARLKDIKLDLSPFSGVALRVRGDGQTYKLNIKTEDRGSDPESTYAATFETTGDWQNIFVPFSDFVGVTRAKTDPNAPPLNPSKIRQVGFRLSRFDFNNLTNPNYRPGPFRLEIEDGIKAFKDVKSRIVTVSSAAVERNAIIGDDAEARKKDIPIVQLNPGGILNYKYMGENAVRSSGLPYTVVRPVGLTTEQAEESFLLEASQGDSISGKITREEAASVVAVALNTTASKGKTIEVRRNEALSSKGKKSNQRDLERLFLAAVTDGQRPKRLLPPLPSVVPPPPPPSEDRVKEILEIPEVKATAQRAKDRVEAEKNRQGASNNGSQPSSNGTKPTNGSQPQSEDKEAQAQDAKEGRSNWQKESAEKELTAR